MANVDAQLNDLVRKARAQTPGSTPATAADPVLVTIRFQPGNLDALRAYLENRGVPIRHAGHDYIEAHLTPGQIVDASQQPGVDSISHVRPPTRPQARANVATQGVSSHGADDWHNAGYRGDAVKVGIIDAGFLGIQRLRGSELPSKTNARCYFATSAVPSNALADCDQNDVHGAAVAEIIHDLAPNAELYVANPVTAGDLHDAVTWMANQGVTVMNQFLAWPPEGPGDGTTIYSNSPLTAIDLAVRRGITWISSAGNTGLSTWYGRFNPGDNTRWHHFSTADAGNAFALEAGQTWYIDVLWEDSWPEADCDLDLYVFSTRQDAQGRYIPYRQDLTRQNGSKRSVPYATVGNLEPLPATEAGIYFIALHRVDCPTPPAWIQITSGQTGGFQYNTPHHQITNPADTRNSGALAVGATHWSDSNAIADYSSRGPTLDGRAKPEIAAAACTRSVSYPAEPSDGLACGSRGTSASVPHVTGLAALVRDSFPAYAPNFVTHYFNQHAAERGATGPDNTWGWGFAALPDPNATAAPIEAGPPSDIKLVNGTIAGEAILSWTPAPGATHYRIGCVNMVRDYPAPRRPTPAIGAKHSATSTSTPRTSTPPRPPTSSAACNKAHTTPAPSSATAAATANPPGPIRPTGSTSRPPTAAEPARCAPPADPRRSAFPDLPAHHNGANHMSSERRDTRPATIIPHGQGAASNLPMPSDQTVRDTMLDARSESTRRAYRAQWRLFQHWAREHQLQPLPALPETVARYLIARHRAGASIATVRSSASAISQTHLAAGHEPPTASETVRLTIAGLNRADHRQPRQAAPLDTAALDAIVAAAKRPRRGRGGSFETAEHAAARGAVDIALALLLSDTGLRRSEAAALDWSDVTNWPDGSGRINVRRSKTDQTGSGSTVYATPRAMAALNAIRPTQALVQGAVFGGLSPAQISRRIQSAATHAGLTGQFAGHSGRVGMAVRMANHGAPSADVMRQGRWQSPTMVARYIRAIEAGAAGKWL